MSGDEFDALVRSFEAFGLSESAARTAAAGRDGRINEDAFDGLVAKFQALGLSEAAARDATVGRDGSELLARRRAKAAADLTPALSSRMEAHETDRRRTRKMLEEMSAGLAQLREALDVAWLPILRRPPHAPKRMSINERGSRRLRERLEWDGPIAL